MMFLKFGKKEHLEQLREGLVHLRPIECYQNDGTSFRGDKMEGKVFLDPKGPVSIDGIDITPWLKEIVFSCGIEGNTFLFCVSMLSKRNCHKIGDELYAPNNDFIDEMLKFGNYFLPINSCFFMEALNKSLQEKGLCYEYHPIKYIDKRQYSDVSTYLSGFSDRENITRQVFLKDLSYKNQFEWRIAIFDSNKKLQIKQNGGVDLITPFSEEMPIFEAKALHTLKCSSEYLFN